LDPRATLDLIFVDPVKKTNGAYYQTKLHDIDEFKGKKEVYLYSALFVVPHTQGAQAWIIQFHLQLHQCLPSPRKCSTDGASLT